MRRGTDVLLGRLILFWLSIDTALCLCTELLSDGLSLSYFSDVVGDVTYSPSGFFFPEP